MKFLTKLVMFLTLCVSAFSQTVTPTNFSASAVGPTANTIGQTRVAKGSDGFLRMLISDNTGGTGSLEFVHCLNTACTADTITPVYTGVTNSCINASDTKLNYSLSMFGDLPRIAIQSSMSGTCTPVDPNNDTGVGLIVCGDADCVSHPLTYVGETEGSDFPRVQSVTTPGDTTYLMSGSIAIISHQITLNLLLYTCNVGSCGAGSIKASAVSRNGPCISPSNLRLGTGNVPVFAYWTSGSSGTVNTADCGTHLNTLHVWYNGADSNFDSTVLLNNVSMDIDSSGLPTMATTVATSFGGTIQLGVFRCFDTGCAGFTKVTSTWPTQVTSQGVTSVSIAPDGFARIAFTYSSATFNGGPLTKFLICANLSCALNTTTTIQSNDATHPLSGYYLSLYTATISGQVINNFGARVANCTASSFPTCSYTTANEVLYQISEVSPDFSITATPSIQTVLPSN